MTDGVYRNLQMERYKFLRHEMQGLNRWLCNRRAFEFPHNAIDHPINPHQKLIYDAYKDDWAAHLASTHFPVDHKILLSPRPSAHKIFREYTQEHGVEIFQLQKDTLKLIYDISKEQLSVLQLGTCKPVAMLLPDNFEKFYDTHDECEQQISESTDFQDESPVDLSLSYDRDDRYLAEPALRMHMRLRSPKEGNLPFYKMHPPLPPVKIRDDDQAGGDQYLSIQSQNINCVLQLIMHMTCYSFHAETPSSHNDDAHWELCQRLVHPIRAFVNGRPTSESDTFTLNSWPKDFNYTTVASMGASMLGKVTIQEVSNMLTQMEGILTDQIPRLKREMLDCAKRQLLIIDRYSKGWISPPIKNDYYDAYEEKEGKHENGPEPDKTGPIPKTFPFDLLNLHAVTRTPFWYKEWLVQEREGWWINSTALMHRSDQKYIIHPNNLRKLGYSFLRSSNINFSCVEWMNGLTVDNLKIPHENNTAKEICAKNRMKIFTSSKAGLYLIEKAFTINGWAEMRLADQRHAPKIQPTQKVKERLSKEELEEKKKKQICLEAIMKPFLDFETKESWLSGITKTEFSISDFKDFVIRETPLPFQTLIYYLLENQQEGEEIWQIVLHKRWLEKITKIMTEETSQDGISTTRKRRFKIVTEGINQDRTILTRERKEFEKVLSFHDSLPRIMRGGDLISKFRERRYRTENFSLQSFQSIAEEDNLCCDKMPARQKWKGQTNLARHAMCSFTLKKEDENALDTKPASLYKVLTRPSVELDVDNNLWVYDNNNPIFIPPGLSISSSKNIFKGEDFCERPFMSMEPECIRRTLGTIIRWTLRLLLAIVPVPSPQQDTYALTQNVEIDVDHEQKIANCKTDCDLDHLQIVADFDKRPGFRSKAPTKNMALQGIGKFGPNAARRQNHEWRALLTKDEFNQSRHFLVDVQHHDPGRDDDDQKYVPSQFVNCRTKKDMESVFSAHQLWMAVQTRQFHFIPGAGRKFQSYKELDRILQRHSGIYADNTSENYYHGLPHVRMPQDIISVLENKLHDALQYGLLLDRKYSTDEVHLALITELFMSLYTMIDYLMPKVLIDIEDKDYDPCSFASHWQCGFVMRLQQEVMRWMPRYMMHYLNVAYANHMKCRYPTMLCEDGLIRFKRTDSTHQYTLNLHERQNQLSRNTIHTFNTQLVKDLYFRDYVYVNEEGNEGKVSGSNAYNLRDRLLFPRIGRIICLDEQIWIHILSYINPLPTMVRLFDAQTAYVAANEKRMEFKQLARDEENAQRRLQWETRENEAAVQEYKLLQELETCREQVRNLRHDFTFVEKIRAAPSHAKQKPHVGEDTEVVDTDEDDEQAQIAEYNNICGTIPIIVIDNDMRKVFKNTHMHQKPEGKCYAHTLRMVPKGDGCRCAGMNRRKAARYKEKMKEYLASIEPESPSYSPKSPFSPLNTPMSPSSPSHSPKSANSSSSPDHPMIPVRYTGPHDAVVTSAKIEDFESDSEFEEKGECEPEVKREALPMPIESPKASCHKCKTPAERPKRADNFVKKRPHVERYMPSFYH